MPPSSLLGIKPPVTSMAKFGIHGLATDLSSPPHLSFIEQLKCRTLFHTPPQQLIRYSREARHLLFFKTPKLPLYVRMLTSFVRGHSASARPGSCNMGDRTNNHPNGQVSNTNTWQRSHESNNKVDDTTEIVSAPAYPPEVVTKKDLAEFEERMIKSISKLVVSEVKKIFANERLVINRHFDESKQIVEKFGEDMKAHFENPLQLSMTVNEKHTNKRSRDDRESYDSDPSTGSSHQKGKKDRGESTRTSKRQKIFKLWKRRLTSNKQ